MDHPEYSSITIERIRAPKFAGKLTSYEFMGESFNPVCGDTLVFYAKCRDQKIEAISFLADGCSATLAAAETMAGILDQRSLLGLTLPEKEEVIEALGGLPESRHHTIELAIDAAENLLRNIQSRLRQ